MRRNKKNKNNSSIEDSKGGFLLPPSGFNGDLPTLLSLLPSNVASQSSSSSSEISTALSSQSVSSTDIAGQLSSELKNESLVSTPSVLLEQIYQQNFHLKSLATVGLVALEKLESLKGLDAFKIIFPNADEKDYRIFAKLYYSYNHAIHPRHIIIKSNRDDWPLEEILRLLGTLTINDLYQVVLLWSYMPPGVTPPHPNYAIYKSRFEAAKEAMAFIGKFQQILLFPIWKPTKYEKMEMTKNPVKEGKGLNGFRVYFKNATEQDYKDFCLLDILFSEYLNGFSSKKCINLPKRTYEWSLKHIQQKIARMTWESAVNCCAMAKVVPQVVLDAAGIKAYVRRIEVAEIAEKFLINNQKEFEEATVSCRPVGRSFIPSQPNTDILTSLLQASRNDSKLETSISDEKISVNQCSQPDIDPSLIELQISSNNPAALAELTNTLVLPSAGSSASTDSSSSSVSTVNSFPIVGQQPAVDETTTSSSSNSSQESMVSVSKTIAYIDLIDESEPSSELKESKISSQVILSQAEIQNTGCCVDELPSEDKVPISSLEQTRECISDEKITTTDHEVSIIETQPSMEVPTSVSQSSSSSDSLPETVINAEKAVVIRSPQPVSNPPLDETKNRSNNPIAEATPSPCSHPPLPQVSSTSSAIAYIDLVDEPPADIKEFKISIRNVQRQNEIQNNHPGILLQLENKNSLLEQKTEITSGIIFPHTIHEEVPKKNFEAFKIFFQNANLDDYPLYFKLTRLYHEYLQGLPSEDETPSSTVYPERELKHFEMEFSSITLTGFRLCFLQMKLYLVYAKVFFYNKFYKPFEELHAQGKIDNDQYSNFLKINDEQMAKKVKPFESRIKLAQQGEIFLNKWLEVFPKKGFEAFTYFLRNTNRKEYEVFGKMFVLYQEYQLKSLPEGDLLLPEDHAEWKLFYIERIFLSMTLEGLKQCASYIRLNLNKAIYFFYMENYKPIEEMYIQGKIPSDYFNNVFKKRYEQLLTIQIEPYEKRVNFVKEVEAFIAKFIKEFQILGNTAFSSKFWQEYKINCQQLTARLNSSSINHSSSSHYNTVPQSNASPTSSSIASPLLIPNDSKSELKTVSSTSSAFPARDSEILDRDDFIAPFTPFNLNLEPLTPVENNNSSSSFFSSESFTIQDSNLLSPLTLPISSPIESKSSLSTLGKRREMESENSQRNKEQKRIGENPYVLFNNQSTNDLWSSPQQQENSSFGLDSKLFFNS